MYAAAVSGMLGDRIKEAREAKGLTIKVLARLVGVTEDEIRKLESGRVKQPAFAVGLKIADALGVNPNHLAYGDKSHRQETGQRSAAVALEELERLLMRISALSRLASKLEDQARDALRRIARG